MSNAANSDTIETAIEDLYRMTNEIEELGKQQFHDKH